MKRFAIFLFALAFVLLAGSVAEASPRLRRVFLVERERVFVPVDRVIVERDAFRFRTGYGIRDREFVEVDSYGRRLLVSVDGFGNRLRVRFID